MNFFDHKDLGNHPCSYALKSWNTLYIYYKMIHGPYNVKIPKLNVNGIKLVGLKGTL